MEITEHGQIAIKFKKKKPYMFYRIIKGIDHMSFLSEKNDIFYLLSLRIYLYDISRECTSWIILISDDKLGFFYLHLDDLVIDGGVIEISS